MKGFTLLEVMVALLVLSASLINIAGMQLFALQQSQDAYLHNIAALQLTSLLERLRVNQSQAARDHELLLWNTVNTRLLPQGKGNYQCKNNLCVANVQWKMKKIYNLSLTGYIKD